MDSKKKMILAHSKPAIERLLRHRWILGGAGGIALLGMVTASAIVVPGEEASVQRQTILEQLAQPSVTRLESGNAEFLREERVQRTDTISSLFSRLGISDSQALDFLYKDREAQVVARQLRPGKVVTAKTREDGELIVLYFPLNGKDATLIIERRNNNFVVREEILRLEPQIVLKSSEIQSSLFSATDTAGIPDAIATQLAEIFSGDIDFHRDLRKGDRFSVVYESLTHNGQPIRSGRILAAEFVNDQKAYHAYWFQREDGKGGYYTADGKSLRKAFLRSPLEFSRVTSGFSNARQHPVLNITRAHKGIDYGAPTGTRVRAVADATVEFAGRQGGYGNLIVLKHRGNYSTAYGHLNGFASGIRKGTPISQGDTIGYVGQTGLSSGPHLHYEFRINSRQVNPMAITLPDSIALEASQVSRFRTATAPLRSHLEIAKQFGLASAE